MNQQKHIKQVLKMKPSGFDPYVETHRETEDGLEYSSWEKWEGQEHVDERSVLPNEVVIDIDAETTEKCRQENGQITTWLGKQGLPSYVADSGGTGFHIHIFFKVPETVNKVSEIDSYRKALYEWLKSKTEEETQVDTELWDDGMVEFESDMNNGHLVRAVGGRKTETGLRKTQVGPTSLKKQEIEEKEAVEYPNLNTQKDFWRIKKVDSGEADLTWAEINEAAEKIQEKKEERRKQKLESDYEAENDGLQALRDIPADEVFKAFYDINPELGKHIYCPVHHSEDSKEKGQKEGRITDGTETKFSEGVYFCFGDSCKEEGENSHGFNAIDLLVESDRLDYTFQEAKEALAEEFDVEIEDQESDWEYDVDYYDSDDFRFEDDDGNEKWDYHYLASVIQKFYNFKYISEDDTDQLFIQEEGIWKEKGESTITNLCMELTNERMFAKQPINHVKQIVKNRNRIYKEENFFEPPKRLVPFQNGVYDVEKDEFRNYREEDNFRFKHDVSFVENLDKKEDNGKIEDFIDSIQDTERKKQILKEVTGLSLLPDFPIDKAPILFGEGSNGKNKFVEMIDKISGTYHEIDMGDYTDDNHASAELENTTIVFFDEFQHIKDPAKVKNFIGSDKIRVRHMQQTGYMAKQIATPILAANELPSPPEQKTSFFRRWEILDFPYKFTSDKNDEFKNMMSDEEIKEKFWTQEALNCYATKAVKQLNPLIERQDYTKGKSPNEIKHIWNNKSNPVYTFLNNFIEQGKLPDEGTSTSTDLIIKDGLVDIVNDYLDMVDAGTIQKNQLTSAIEASDDIERGNDQQAKLTSGKTKMAYSGLRLTLPDNDDFKESNHLGSSGITELVRDHWDMFSDLSSKKAAHIVEIVKMDLYQDALLYLHNCEEKSAPLLDVIKALDLEEDEINELMSCEYINTVSSIDSGTRFPVLEFDEEEFDRAVNDSETLIKKSGDYVPVSRWVSQRARELTKNQRVDVDDYFIDPGKQEGYDEDELEKAVDNLTKDGDYYDPKPGKIEVLS